MLTESVQWFVIYSIGYIKWTDTFVWDSGESDIAKDNITWYNPKKITKKRGENPRESGFSSTRQGSTLLSKNY